MDSSKIIGKGGFGVVVKEGERARKHFKKLEHMTRELIMLRYMRSSGYIAKNYTHNLKDLSLTLQRWDASLLMVMSSGYDMKDDAKLRIFRHVLKALSHMHQAGMVHSDVTTANILIDTTDWNACLCDLGLSSTKKYSRVGQTAIQHRPINPIPCEGHDMYGLAVCMIQLFGKMWIHVQKTAKELRDITRSEPLIAKKLRDVFLKMLPDNPLDSITSHEVLFDIFKEKTVFEVPSVKYYKEKIELELIEFMKAQMFQVCATYRINRNIRCHKCLVQYLSGPTGSQISISYYDLYMVAACFLFASLYGSKEFDHPKALSCIEGRYTKEDFIGAVEALIQDNNFVGLAMMSVD